MIHLFAHLSANNKITPQRIESSRRLSLEFQRYFSIFFTILQIIYSLIFSILNYFKYAATLLEQEL